MAQNTVWQDVLSLPWGSACFPEDGPSLVSPYADTPLSFLDDSDSGSHQHFPLE